MIRAAGVAVVSLMTAASVFIVPSAGAVPKPVIDINVDVPPPDPGHPGPEVPMKQARDCATSAVLQGFDPESVPLNAAFSIPELHKFARGDGQTVAIIDSGVQPVSRLLRITGGGDFVDGGDGLTDCDHHGTGIAGLIAAQPSPDDAFVGVAPGVSLISIRHTSAEYDEDTRGDNKRQPWQITESQIRQMAQAIVHAANLGATVINMSLNMCLDASNLFDTHVLAGALYYAAVEKNIVIVASAGNVQQSAGRCEENPSYNPADPEDPRNWKGTRSVSLPGYFSDLVLSVGAVDVRGNPMDTSMSGAWVGTAAPGAGVVTLDPTEPHPGAVVNGIWDPQKKASEALGGTSYAAALVSGLVALIRERYPDLTSRQVVNRILKTARTPGTGINNFVGYGTVDPVAALTSTIPAGDIVAPGVPPDRAPVPIPPPPPDNTARNVFMVTGLVTLVTITVISLAAFASGSNRRRRL